ncbi:DMT family transporter [Alloacidobacterium sp.]|uniref:DMT family transporter n=1 Tax=Alloacidobacterium sp. TaxID=2951999 RepID=UPI002D53B14E|nr:DMT family transporter [Alloacidobacterium sp.]HYK36506.1 DMT family transporter [Alloacidobacterium sp.]
MSRSLRAHLLLIAVVFIWGATFVLIKDALRDVSPLLFNFIRMTLAFACLAIVYRSHWKHVTRRSLASGAVVGFCLAMGYQFQTAGLRLTTPSKSAFITGLVVVMVPMLSGIPFLRPKGAHIPQWNAYFGALIAFVGIVLLTTPAGAGFDFLSINRGDVLTLGCALGFALHVLALAHTAPRVSYTQLAVLQIGFCALFMAISGPILEHPHIRWSPRVVFALLIAAFLATAAAFTVQTWAQQFLPATNTALILALEPVFAWVTSFVVLGERLDLRASAGALLILAGIALTELLPNRMQPTAHETVPLN